MSDPTDTTSLAIGAAVTAAVGLVFAFIRSLFARNVSAAEKTLDKMQTDLGNILLELRSMHDEQTRQRSEIAGLGKDLATVSAQAKAAHDRIDALVAPAPRSRK